MNTRSHQLSLQLKVGSVNRETGLLCGVTVGKAGVQAQGHFVYLNAKGEITRDQNSAVKKLPVFTDEKFLTTLLGAAQDVGGRVKSRSDHSDDLNARAGSAVRFVRDGDRVACDLQLLNSYKDRAIVLETAELTPELIGCSIDFLPSFEVVGEKAFMRVEELYAVDIVDQGAITPAGMFLRHGVDKETEDKVSHLQTPPKMTSEEISAAITAALKPLSDTVGQLAAKVEKLTPAAPATGDIATQLAAIKTTQDTFIAEQKAELAKLSKERSALGLSAATIKSLETLAEQTEAERLAAEKASGEKGYLQLVAEHVAATKCKKTDAHLHIQRTKGEAYQAYLVNKGVARAA